MSDYIGIMPLQFNSNLGSSLDELISQDKLDVTIQIEVDAAVAQSLLPTWKSSDGKTCGYRPWAAGPTGKPLLFINYTQERDVDYMAGGGYNEVEFYLSAEFVGENSWTHDGKEYDGVYGMFAILLMPSNLIPLLAGRELMGTPKHMADVADLVLKESDDEDKYSGTFEIRNLHGSAFLAGNLRNIAPAGYAILNEPMPEHDEFLATDGWQDAANVEPGFKVTCWKHIPAADWAHSPPILVTVLLYLSMAP